MTKNQKNNSNKKKVSKKLYFFLRYATQTKKSKSPALCLKGQNLSLWALVPSSIAKDDQISSSYSSFKFSVKFI